MSQSLREALANARTALDRAKSAAKANTRLSAEGKRMEVARTSASAISRVVKELRATKQHANTLETQYRAANAAALEKMGRMSDTVWAEVARTARESEGFRAELSALCMTGALGNPAHAALLTAVLQSPHPAVMGLSAADYGAARAQLENYLDADPAVTGIREQLDDARLAVSAAKRALKDMEPDLDLDELKKAGVLPPSPYDLPEQERQAWLMRDPSGWALAAAETGFNWDDSRPMAA